MILFHFKPDRGGLGLRGLQYDYRVLKDIRGILELRIEDLLLTLQGTYQADN